MSKIKSIEQTNEEEIEFKFSIKPNFYFFFLMFCMQLPFFKVIVDAEQFFDFE